MTISVIPASELTEDLCRKWRQIQEADPDLASPYFAPEFSAAVGSVRPDARVAIIEDGGKIEGFFPFQRGKFGIGKPIGGHLSDYHGLIASKDLAVDVGGLLRACGLVAWDFNHLPLSQTVFREHSRRESRSPLIDLSRGYMDYVAERRAAGSEQVEQCARKLRKLEREVGPVRFEMQVTDASAFDELLRWKSQQYARTGVIDILRSEWAVEILRRLRVTKSASFGGILSAMYVRDKMVAAHLGMHSSKVWHYWFPAYDPELTSYSTGLVLLLKMAESAASLRLQKVDLGKGDHRYKLQLMNAAIPLGEGTLERRSVICSARRAAGHCESWVRRTKFIRTPLRAVVHVSRAAIRKLKGPRRPK